MPAQCLRSKKREIVKTPLERGRHCFLKVRNSISPEGIVAKELNRRGSSPVDLLAASQTGSIAFFSRWLLCTQAPTGTKKTMPSTTFTVRVETDVKKRLEKLARSTGRSR